MKKRVIFGIFIMLFFLNLSFAVAVENETGVDKAYSCLTNKVSGNCTSLSTEEKIFSLLAINKCQSELLADAKANECWPNPNCQIKQTAQAVLALDNSNSEVSAPKQWLLSHTTAPTDLIWYLQIESAEATACAITYSGASYNINIGEDKKITGNPGNCLSLSQGDYWLEVSSVCYGTEFSISCDKDFLTSLLFKKTDSSTIHVPEEAKRSSPQGTLTETVNSFCFSQGTSCDYEGSLWATLTLLTLNEDVSSFIPYLVSMEGDNSEFLPESFLFILTNSIDYKNNLLSKQINNQYWSVSGDKYYDTALALYPFIYNDFQEKTNSKTWLLEIQDNQGCWQGNIRDTAFILYSLFPRTFTSPDDTPDCGEKGYYCRLEAGCIADGGSLLSEYDCLGGSTCCSVAEQLQTCFEQSGEICNSTQICTGTTVTAFDATLGNTCCYNGVCQDQGTTNNDCESNLGTCRQDGCLGGEDENTDYTCDFNDYCCFSSSSDQGGSTLWIWILLILIVLVIIGIVFKNKLSAFFMRFGKGKPKGPPQPPRGFPSSYPQTRMIPRRMPLPQSVPIRRPQIKRQSEVDEVLKKLKEMGK